MSASSLAPPSDMRTYSRPSERAIDWAILVLPTPGGIDGHGGPIGAYEIRPLGNRALAESWYARRPQKGSGPLARTSADQTCLGRASLPRWLRAAAGCYTTQGVTGPHMDPEREMRNEIRLVCM